MASQLKTHRRICNSIIASLCLSACQHSASLPNSETSRAPRSTAISESILYIDNIPVLAIRPKKEINALSIIMVPGGGLSSKIYTQTANNERGWAYQLADSGYSVYITNPAVAEKQGEASGRKWSLDSALTLWGWANKDGQIYDDIRLDISDREALESIISSPRTKTANLSSLIDKVGDSVVLAHSFGGRATFELASQDRQEMRGVIAVEPLACPTDANRLERDFVEAERPLLTIWGDRLDRGRPSMKLRYASCKQAALTITQLGGIALTDTLSERGIRHNSHLMMIEDNHQNILRDIIKWLDEYVSKQ